MTHADLVNDALLWFLIVMTLLLVMCVAAVFFAPAEAASSPYHPGTKRPRAALPLPTRRPLATTPPLRLPTRRPRAAAPRSAAAG
jgi:hypothetical protein